MDGRVTAIHAVTAAREQMRFVRRTPERQPWTRGLFHALAQSRRTRASRSTAAFALHSIVAEPTVNSVHDQPGTSSESPHLGVTARCSRSMTVTTRSVTTSPCDACLLYTSDAADDL